MSNPIQKPLFITSTSISNSRGIYSHNSNRSSHFRRTKKPISSLQQFIQIKLKSTTHRTHMVRLQVRIYKILKIRHPIFRRHLKKQIRIRSLPIKILSHIISRNRESKNTPIRISSSHNFNISFIYQLHFLLQFTKFKIKIFTSKFQTLILQILRTNPIQRNIRKRSLGTPTTRNI